MSLVSLVSPLLGACTDDDLTADEGTSQTDGESEGGSEADSTETADGWTGEGTSSDTGEPVDFDAQIAALLRRQPEPVVPLPDPPAEDPAMVALGEALFFDPILSGNMDTACASCHHPSFATGDGLSLSVGTGAVGIGPVAVEGEHPPFIARHAPTLFNLGQPGFEAMFWDGRVERVGGELHTPAGDALLPGVDGPLAAQAMFPVLDRGEMRGQPGDTTTLGGANELAELPDDDPQAIWAAIMQRLLAVAGYQQLFAAAYPDEVEDALTFAHAANAIAAYQRQAFSLPRSPWDDYLAGDLDALTDAEKWGAILFYGTAGCGACHTGPLLTDHRMHSTGVPQLGPGLPNSAPFDHGRELATGSVEDRFQFRTPSLRNVAESAPYMHDGVLIDLEDVVRHYAQPSTSVERYEPDLLLAELVPTLQTDEAHVAEMVATLSSDLAPGPAFAGLSNLREFLEALSDPEIFELANATPSSVPSGLPVPGPG